MSYSCSLVVSILLDIIHSIKIVLAAMKLVPQVCLLSSSNNQPLENISVSVSTSTGMYIQYQINLITLYTFYTDTTKCLHL